MLSIRPNTENINLNELDSTITPGIGFSIGNAKFTFLCGCGQPHPDWTGLSSTEKLNAVGRHLDDPADALLAIERYLHKERIALRRNPFIVRLREQLPFLESVMTLSNEFLRSRVLFEIIYKVYILIYNTDPSS
jgi:hypothetical protein